MGQVQAIDWLRQGVAAAKSGDRAKARELLEEAIRLDPRSEIAWFWYAGVLEDIPETIEALGYVLEINPGNEKAIAALRKARMQGAIHEIRKGNRESGRKTLLEICSADPTSELAWLWLSGTTDDPEEAIGYLNRVLEINPNNHRAKAGLEFYRVRADSTRSPWQCPICQHTTPNKQQTCPDCGAILTLTDVDVIMANGSADEEAIRTGITRLLGRARVKPDFSLHCYIGIAYLNLNRLNEAIDQFRVALRLQDSDPLRMQLDILQHRRSQRDRESRRVKSDPTEAPRRVMVVDDSATLRKIIAIIAEKNGVRVTEAVDGNEAIEKIHEEGPPDLILIEGDTSSAASFDLCRAIRRDSSSKKLPVIVLSGREGFFRRLRWRIAGASGAIPKPIHPDQLVQIFREYQMLTEPSAA